MIKKVKLNEEAQQKLKKGIDIVADAVQSTLGPAGYNAVLDKGYGMPHITNDGVSVARDIELKDRFETMGAELIKDVAEKTNTNVGDGTTTSVVLARALINEGLKYIAMGHRAMDVKKEIDKSVKEVVNQLKNIAKPIKSKKEALKIATLSAEDEEIGKIVTDVVYDIVNDSGISIETSHKVELSKEVVKGLQFNQGYVSSHFITDKERAEAEYKDVYILITDQKINILPKLLPLLEKLANDNKKDLVIIADDVEGQALASLIVNKQQNRFNTLVIKAPGYGDEKQEDLEDLAMITGGKVISEKTGMKLEDVELNMLGRADRVVSTKEKTTIVGGKGEKTELDKRTKQLETQFEKARFNFEKELIKKRLAKLMGGIAVIKVGASTESETKYKRDKIEDAVHATKAAIDEGVVPGGGIAFKECSNIESNIVKKAILVPYNLISENVEVKKDIIDPLKVVRVALENAASMAGMFLTTKVAIAEVKNEISQKN